MKKNNKKRFFCALERFFIKLFVVLIIGLVVLIVFTETTLAKKNIEVQNKTREVNEQKKVNESLLMKIDEMTSLDNMKHISEEFGLYYNSDNIKTVG